MNDLIEQIQQFIERAWNTKFRGSLSVTALISEVSKKQVNSLLKKNITEYFLNADDIRHIKKHSKDSLETTGQLPFTLSDAQRIPEIMANPDKIEKGTYTSTNGIGVKFIKVFPDGRIFCVLIDKFENGEISPKTSYKKPLQGIDELQSKTPNHNVRNAQALSVSTANITNFYIMKAKDIENLKGNTDLELLELEVEAELELLKFNDTTTNNYPERKGNITSDELKKTFAFRYVNTDINLDEAQEQQMLNVSYDTFRHLAMVIDKPMSAIGLGRNLTLNVGIVRMEFRTGGCYRPQYRSMNFKTLDDFKHIAHEWLHAFDHYLRYTFGEPNIADKNDKLKLMSECNHWKINHLPTILRYKEETLRKYNVDTTEAFNLLIDAVKKSNYAKRSADVAKIARDNYWKSNCEMLARAFEVYSNRRMDELQIVNNHLVSMFPNNPYPNTADESDNAILHAFDKLFSTMTVKTLEQYDTESLYGNK